MAKIIDHLSQGEILAQMAEEKKITRLVDVGELEADLKKDLAEEEAKGKDADILFCESIEDELSDLENLPTVDPESLRPTAKWIIVRRMADGAECKCGICGRKEVFTTFDRHTEHAYCCRCGCKMEEADESEVRKK
jgi:hypothetical protein|nr:MAG TPA: DNA primase/helicase [Caudoviricetes sp.]